MEPNMTNTVNAAASASNPLTVKPAETSANAEVHHDKTNCHVLVLPREIDEQFIENFILPSL